jgi:protein-tyrosine phosphatase
MLGNDLIHFVATDAHGCRSRRPLLKPAFERVCRSEGVEVADALFCRNPAAVARGEDVPLRLARPRRSLFGSWFGRRRAG